jgi:orotidine-5'-phosphate decarboxylase
VAGSHLAGSSIESRVVFALDFPGLEGARAAVHTVRDAVGMVKVGLELFVQAGPPAVALGAEVGRPVFLDLKLHDIPETVERAVARASALGARVLTVHASGGPAMLRRAVARAHAEGDRTEIAAITVLTSFDASDLAAIGVGGTVASQVVRLARMAWSEGVRTFVSSPHEASALRDALGPEATLITPGVRPSSTAGGDDQKRTMTARDAVASGADWVVVGRPIRDAADPAAAARAIADEVRGGFAARVPARG